MAGVITLILSKFYVFTVGATIVRRQTVNLGNAGAVSQKRRAYTSSRANHIPFFTGVLNQKSGNIIKVGIAVTDNTFQFFLESVLYNLRKWISVESLRRFTGNALNVLGTSLNFRREIPLRNRTDIFNHIGNFICVCYNYFICFFGRQIAKFIQHFLCCSEIKRCLHIGIVIALSCLQNTSENLVTFTQEVHVACCYNGFLKLFAKGDYFSVKFAKSFSVRHSIVTYKIVIVSYGLYLKIVIVGSNFLNFALILT